MSTPQLILWVAALAVGLSCLRTRNLTALALVIAFAVSEAGLPLEYYVYSDAFVIAAIFAKFQCSPADRFVLLTYPVAWFFYVADVPGSSAQWFHLFWIAIAQFAAVITEGIWQSRSVARRETKGGGGSPIDRDSFIKTLIPTQVFGYSATPDADPPALVFPVPRHAGFTGRIGAGTLAVSPVGSLIAVTQIRNAVVGWVTVHMVDYARPFAVVHGPSNPMRERPVSEYDGLPIPKGGGRRESLSARPSSVEGSPTGVVFTDTTRALQPKEFTSLRLIAEKLTKRFRGGYFSNSHSEASLRGGQGRALFTQRFRPAFSSTFHPVSQPCAAERALVTASGGGGDG